ncbi:prostaglandin-H2 D-isomerase-like [Tachyglossus aculeatus]|uniref:prostaglandin-H2 D-isomerase-like n=1 Tax=Tachyglossus aculeatus TaxID=9261 RepID=UPI0018F2D51D|nr:prostaglandin-H2 D-isomerase-like [Tachyglossus aculeatus]
MKTILLLGVMLVLFQEAEANFGVKESFDLNQFAGFWYVSAVAAKNVSTLNIPPTKRIGSVLITPQVGAVNFTFMADLNGSCVRREQSDVQMVFPGIFQINPAISLTVVDTDYMNFAFVLTSGTFTDGEFKFLTAYGRARELDIEDEMKFCMALDSEGIPHKQKIFLKNDDTCARLMKEDYFSALL